MGLEDTARALLTGPLQLQRIYRALEAAELRGWEAGKEAAAKTCDSMVIGGRAWTSEQAVAADALLAAAQKIRALNPPAQVKGERKYPENCPCGDYGRAPHPLGRWCDEYHQPPRAGAKWVRTKHAVGDDHFEKGESITIMPTETADTLLEYVRWLAQGWTPTPEERTRLLATIDQDAGE